MTVNFGLTHFVQCVNDVPPGSDFYGCNTFDLGSALALNAIDRRSPAAAFHLLFPSHVRASLCGCVFTVTFRTPTARRAVKVS